MGLQTAVLVRVPKLHDLVPDKVYPSLHDGVQDDPCARVEVQPEPGAPLSMAPDASKTGGAIIVLNTTEDDVNEVTVSPVILE